MLKALWVAPIPAAISFAASVLTSLAWYYNLAPMWACVSVSWVISGVTAWVGTCRWIEYRRLVKALNAGRCIFREPTLHRASMLARTPGRKRVISIAAKDTEPDTVSGSLASQVIGVAVNYFGYVLKDVEETYGLNIGRRPAPEGLRGLWQFVKDTFTVANFK